MNASRRSEDLREFRNEDLILKLRPHDPSRWNESRYEDFLDGLCGHREYQKDAIRMVLSYWIGGRYSDLKQLAKDNFGSNHELRHRWGRWESLQPHLQLPEQLSCTLDLATGTGKSYVLYGVAAILLAEGYVDRVLILCPSNTIEFGLLQKFKELATNSSLRDLIPADAKIAAPRIINASETIVDGSICVENYHAVLDHVSSSIRSSLIGKGERTAVFNDEAHHVVNQSNQEAGKWKEFLRSPQYGFRYILGVSGTCYVGDEYFSDVLFRYSLRQAIEERFVKKIEYVAEMPSTNGQEDRWQLIWQRHESAKNNLKNRNIRPLTIVVTQKISSCKQVSEELIDWLVDWEKIPEEVAREKILVVTSAKEHQSNILKLRSVDSVTSKVEWIISVSMLSEGWDVKNVFQIVPHEERAFNSKLLIAQVLGRGLRRPDGWTGSEPVVTIFNHDSWSNRIKHLVNEILEIEQRLSSRSIVESPYHFLLSNLNYERKEEITDHPQTGEYQIFSKGYVVLPSQVVQQAVTVEFEEALSGKHNKFNTVLRQRTHSMHDVAEQLYLRLKSIDQESAESEDVSQRTSYCKRFPREKCLEIVSASLKRAGIDDGQVTDDNRQRFLQALGPLHRKGAKRVIYTLSPNALVEIDTRNRPTDSCSAADLRRSSRTVFFTDNCLETINAEQTDFFTELVDEHGDFSGARFIIENPADFKTSTNLTIADAGPERRFLGMLTARQNSIKIDAWLKNTATGFYSLEYAWRKGEHQKRGEFNPDFFIKTGSAIIVVEIKDDSEISDPSMENIKKHEYAVEHFNLLNKWLERDGIKIKYQFNMLAPRDFNAFFQKLREDTLPGFYSELDVAMINANNKSA